MVSYHEYADELRLVLAIATERGEAHVLVDAGNIHYSLSNRYELQSACWGAMEAAMGEDDRVVMMGSSILYRLPRPH
jgi:hypothetical protein